MPVRIQRSRARGWRMPEGAIYVGRPTIWGNPFGFNAEEPGDRQAAVAAYRRLLTQPPNRRRHQLLRVLKGNEGRGEGRIAEMVARLSELRGHDLACWCPLDQACHADVLIEIANG